MRVLFLIRGNYHYTAELANALARSGQDVAVVAHDAAADFVGLGSDSVHSDYRGLLDDRIRLEWVSIPGDTTLSTVKDNIASAAAIYRAVRKYDPDILHIHDAADYRFMPALLWAKRKRALVLTVHDATLHPGCSASKMKILWKTNRRLADAVIVHGSDIRERLMANFRLSASKVHTIPRGPYSIYNRWASGTHSSNSRNVLFFGRMHLYKGLEYLIRAAPLVFDSVPDARFVIAGAGPDWPRCKEMISDKSRFDLRDYRIPEPEVTQLFEDCAMVVLPYIEASQSGVLFIAYALAKPVVVTKVGSLPEVVDHGVTGLVVPPADSQALAAAIEELLANPERAAAMGEAGRKKVESGDLSWDSIANKTVLLYRSVANLRRHQLGG